MSQGQECTPLPVLALHPVKEQELQYFSVSLVKFTSWIFLLNRLLTLVCFKSVCDYINVDYFYMILISVSRVFRRGRAQWNLLLSSVQLQMQASWTRLSRQKVGIWKLKMNKTHLHLCILRILTEVFVFRCGWGHDHWSAGPQKQCPAPANQGCLPAICQQGMTFTGLEIYTFLLSPSPKSLLLLCAASGCSLESCS